MMPVKLSLRGCVLMQSRLAEASRGLTLVILAMTMLPGSGIFTRASPRSTSTVGFCTKNESLIVWNSNVARSAHFLPHHHTSAQGQLASIKAMT